MRTFIYLFLAVWGMYSWELTKRGLALKNNNLRASFAGTLGSAIVKGFIQPTNKPPVTFLDHHEQKYQCADKTVLGRYWRIRKAITNQNTWAAIRNQARTYANRKDPTDD